MTAELQRPDIGMWKKEALWKALPQEIIGEEHQYEMLQLTLKSTKTGKLRENDVAMNRTARKAQAVRECPAHS